MSAGEESEADRYKRLGNEAFAAKKYDDALKHYSEAIKLDPENAIYYSNRSACHASKGAWQPSLDDAALCLSKDPKFIKGYYRLATAQTELGRFDDADATVTAALQIEPANEQLVKQKNTIKTKRIAAMSKPKKAAKQLDEAQLKELMELQEQTNTYNKDLRSVQLRIANLQREARACQVTGSQVSPLADTVPLYRAVGKAFIRASKSDVEAGLDNEIAKNTRNQRELTDRMEFLERRIASNYQHLRDLTAGM